MPFLNRDSSNVTHRYPTVLAMVIVAGALLAAAPASSQTAPVAVDNYDGTVVDQALVVALPGVLSNDTDADLDPLTAVLVTDVPIAEGTLALASDGSFTFTPAIGFSGTTVFTYIAQDDEGPPPNDSNVATVSIFVAAPEEVLVGGCVNESNGQTNNCVANDLTFVELGLGTQNDGCVNPADRLTIFMKGVVRNATAQTRYDVGTWFPLPDPDYPDPGGFWDFQIDPEADGASTGKCAVVGMMNPETLPVTNTCTGDEPPGNLILDLGDGP